MITLNLLPPEHKQLLQHLMFVRQWRKAMVVCSAMVLMVVGGLEGERLLLSRRQRALEQQLQTLTAQQMRGESGDITRAATNLQTLTTRLERLGTTPRSWDYDLNRLINALPNNITITSLTLSADGLVTLDGIALTRTAFLDLQEQLLRSPLLENVQTDSTPSRRENVPFHYSGQLKS